MTSRQATHQTREFRADSDTISTHISFTSDQAKKMVESIILSAFYKKVIFIANVQVGLIFNKIGFWVQRVLNLYNNNNNSKHPMNMFMY